MREISANIIENAVTELFIKANSFLPSALENKILSSANIETNEIAKGIFCDMCKNLDCARELNIPICQDTGMAVVFLEVGQDVHIEGCNLEDAVNEGVRQGYVEGYLRKSVVKDPIYRENTKDNTPAVIHYSIVPGDKVTITVAPKGFGSENMSQIRMFKPSAGLQGIKDFIIEAVETAGPNPCPPISTTTTAG